MKNFKMLVIGFVAGAACMVTTTAIAANVNVSAMLKNDTIFKINGKDIASPADQPVLNYKDRIYVPIRFVADNLKCEVNWDAATHRVIVDSPAPEVITKEVIKEVEKIVYVNEDENPEKVVYSTLPLKRSGTGYEVQITGVNRKEYDDCTKVNFTFKNTGDRNLQIKQMDAILTVDGKEYPAAIDSKLWDPKLFKDISKDSDIDSYFVFNLIPEDYEKCTLSFNILTNDNQIQKTKTVEFNFKK